MYALDLDDPRAWPRANAAIPPYVDAQRAVDAATRADADALDARLRDWVARALAAGEGELLARTLGEAPSLAIARHLRRLLADVERAPHASSELHTTLFAIPVIVVAGLDTGAAPVSLGAVLPDVAALAAILRDARAFGGCETFALSSAPTGSTLRPCRRFSRDARSSRMRAISRAAHSIFLPRRLPSKRASSAFTCGSFQAPC